MRYLENIFKMVVVGFLVIIIITVVLQILAREVIYMPVSWTQEAAKYSFIWMSLIGAALGIRRFTHVSIDIFVQKLPGKIQYYLNLLSHILIIIFMGFLSYYSVIFSLNASSQNSPTLGISMSIVYLSLLIFTILSTVFSIEKIVNLINKR